MKKKTAIVSLLLVTVLLLTACGGGNGNEKAAAAVPSVEGTWDLVSATGGEGGEDVASELAAVREMGATLQMTFKDGKMTLYMEYMGQSDSQETDYRIEDGKLVAENSKMDIRMEGDKLILSEGGNSITLQRKEK